MTDILSAPLPRWDARFRIDPITVVKTILPPGNTIVAVRHLSDGRLEFAMTGIDASAPVHNEPAQLRLMCAVSPADGPRFWFEPEDPAPPASLSRELAASINAAAAARRKEHDRAPRVRRAILQESFA